MDKFNTMKKSLILSLFIGLLTLNSFSQNKNTSSKSKSTSSKSSGSGSFEKGQIDFNIGVGFFNNNVYYRRGFYRPARPLSLSLDFAITKNVSVGGYFAYSRSVYKYDGKWNNGNGFYDYTDTYTWTYYIAGVRAAYHLAEYIKVDNLDIYGGVMVGNNFAKYRYSTNDPYKSRTITYNESYGGLVWGLYAGGRYMFTNNIGMFGEFGYGLSYGTIGLNIKL